MGEEETLRLGQKAEQELSREGNGQSRWFLYQRGSGKWEQDKKESKAQSTLVCVSGTPTSLALLECGGWAVRCKRQGSLSGLWQTSVNLWEPVRTVAGLSRPLGACQDRGRPGSDLREPVRTMAGLSQPQRACQDHGRPQSTSRALGSRSILCVVGSGEAELVLAQQPEVVS